MFFITMGRNLTNGLLGVVIIFLVIVLHSLICIFYVESTTVLENTGVLRVKKLGDYISVSGLATIFPLKCHTCALIGTTGHLLNSSLGSEIDQRYSCIFRLGFAPTRGYEQHVGSRTTARVVDSFRFYPFLKKPSKLVTGPFPSDFWFLFDRSPGDITRYHGPLLKNLVQKHDTRFLWFSSEVEKEIMHSVADKQLYHGLKRISPMSFVTRIIEDAGCNTLTVYGVPDAQICKRSLNVSLPSLYWDEKFVNVCLNGVDASSRSTSSKAPVSIVPTTLERKSLRKWAEQKFYKFDFKYPTWPL